MIGKSKNTKCFKTSKKFTCTLQCKKKTWMTSNLFEAEMMHWGRECQLQKRKILLHVDNCPAHPVLEKLENIKPLNPELNPICYLLALLGAHHFLHVSRIRVKLLIFRLLMSYIYGAPILDVSRSHTTQHSR